MILEVLMKQLLSKKIGLVFIILQFILTLVFSAIILYVDMLPNKYVLIIALGLIFVLLYTFFSQMSKKFYVLGRVLSGIFCVMMIVAGGYICRGYMAINNMANSNIRYDNLSAIVLAEDNAQTINDAIDYKYGIISTIGREHTDAMISSIQTDSGKTLAVTEYNDILSLVDALYNKEAGVIIFNEAYRETVLESREAFDTETRVLGNYQVETVVDVQEEEDTDDLMKPFVMYLSGIDTRGSISLTSRSDVNIIAVINPATAQILLVNTPRDYYVPLSISNGTCDKLTHAGIYGIDVSIETLEMLYDVDVDYYVRVNFSGFEDVVNALGGVDVYSDVSFTSDWGPSFKKGYNHVDGKQALAFCRERHHFSDGDRQRGRNHQHMIAAILDKATSPKIITKYSSLLKSLEDSFETNMKTKRITKYVKFQMDENPKWKINSISVDGKGGSNYTYSIPSKKAYVMYPDEASIEAAKNAIKRIIDGKKLKSEADSGISKEQ